MRGRMILTSGRKLEFSSVKLFNALHINHLQSLMNSAETMLQGYASPFGAIGSWSHVMSVFIANSLVESAVNKRLSSEARQLLKEYQQLLTEIRRSGQLVALDQIDGIEIPIPNVWRSIVSKQISTPTGMSSIQIPYVHNGDPYVVLGGETSEVSILWDKVEQYEVA